MSRSWYGAGGSLSTWIVSTNVPVACAVLAMLSTTVKPADTSHSIWRTNTLTLLLLEARGRSLCVALRDLFACVTSDTLVLGIRYVGIEVSIAMMRKIQRVHKLAILSALKARLQVTGVDEFAEPGAEVQQCRRRITQVFFQDQL